MLREESRRLGGVTQAERQATLRLAWVGWILGIFAGCAGPASEPSPFDSLRESLTRPEPKAEPASVAPEVSPAPAVGSLTSWLAAVEDAADSGQWSRAVGPLRALQQHHLPELEARPEHRIWLAYAARAEGRPKAFERWLRRELAEGVRAVEAALILASEFAVDERFDDAYAVLDEVIARDPRRLDLKLARARVMIDAGDLEPAVTRLDALFEEHPHPRIAWAACSAERLLGRRTAALARIRTLRTEFADHPWFLERADGIAELEAELASDSLGNFTERELLTILRSSEDVVLRTRALRTLVESDSEWVANALRIGRADENFSVRLETLKLGATHVVDPLGWLEAGLADPSSAVRGRAARYLTGLPSSVAIPSLLSFLDREEDGYVVGQMNQALARLFGEPPVEVPRELDSAAIQEVREAWRKRWEDR